MFDGYMPEFANAAKSNVVSGVETIPTVATLGLPTEGAKVGIVSVRSARAVPRVMSIGAPVSGIQDGFGFPPESFAGLTHAGLPCGLTEYGGGAFGGTQNIRMACVLEYGSGSCLNRVMFDWRPGAYNLPPCEFARVSALPWGTNWSLGRQTVLASIAEGELQQALDPIASASGPMVAATMKRFLSPANAVGVEVLNADNTLSPVIVVNGANKFTRNYVTGAFVPGWTPIDTFPGTLIEVTSDVAAQLSIQWTLQL